MTDDSNARYRSSDPFARAPDPDGHGNDPLAELARLIGQSDQFSGREHQAAPREPQYREPQYYDDPPPAQQRDRPAYDPRYDDPDPRDSAQHSAPTPDWHSPAAAPFDPFAPASSRATDLPEEPPQRTSHAEFSFPPLHAEHSPHFHSSSYDQPPLGAPVRQEPAGVPSQLHLSSDRAPSPPPLDEYYDDAPQGGRRSGLLTVVAVFMLAVVGTAGAFGYRTWFGGPGVKPAPAVIRASTEPAKVAPPAPAADPNSNKISYDRFGDRGQNEKVVLREEKPVDLKDATRSPAVTSSAVPIASQPAAAAAAPSGANPPSVLTEPKRVRTVPIRPDAPDATVARPAMVTPPSAAAPAPVRQTAVASAAPSNAPLDLANPSSPPPQARAAAPRPAPPAAVRPAPAAPSGNAPLSLAPEASSSPAAATRSAPARVAAAAPAGNGSYLVQVSSQRSEADAQSAFRSVKSKYSSVLGDRQPVIRRAELAGKGTYYRAMVGPFTTRDQAIQLCSSLKAAGGDCVVQAN